jgi:thioredoxin-like negative regulator of GroEL
LRFAANQWLEQEPESSKALFYAGEAADELGDYEAAAQRLSRIPDSSPNYSEAMRRLTILNIGPLNRPDQVEPLLVRMAQVATDPASAHRELLRHYGITVQRRKAAELARNIIRYDPSMIAAYIYLMAFDSVVFSAGEEINLHWLASGTDDQLYRVAALVNRARSAGLGESAEKLVDSKERKNELAHQEHDLLECLKDYPDNTELIAMLVNLYADRGDEREVARLLAKVPASAADDSRFYRYKGWVHQMRQEHELAEQAFGLAISKDPYDWKARHQLAEILRLQNRPQESAASLEIATMGTSLRKSILGLKSLEEIPHELLAQLQRYADAVGDDEVASLLGKYRATIQIENQADVHQ